MEPTTVHRKRERYELVEHCDRLHFPGDSLSSLRTTYHSAYLPPFMLSMLRHDADSLDRQMMRHCPEIFSWTADRDYFLRPNTPKYNHQVLMDDFGERWKEQGRLCLIAWHVHPLILPHLASSTPDESSNSSKLAAMRIHEIEELSGIEFLATPFDLRTNHVRSLEMLQKHVYEELRCKYGLAEPKEATLYFHTYNMPDCAVLHLQIRYGSSLHAAEDSRTFYLDDVIAWLKSGRDFLDCLNSEQRSTYFYAGDNQILMEYLGQVKGCVVERNLPNPYFVSI
jgi:hypothetical protein